MADYSDGEAVVPLLTRFLEAPSLEKVKILEALCYTPFGPIVKYFRRELDPCEIGIFEESLMKYIFPYHLKLAYPDNTYCRNCNSMSHITDAVKKVLFSSNEVLADYYHFEHLAKFPKNNSTSVTCFGYYGVSRHRQIFNLEEFDSKPSVRWYSAREEIDDSYDGWNLAQYCYPFTGEIAMANTATKEKHFPFDDCVFPEPAVER